jgi:hypothetical protein
MDAFGDLLMLELEKHLQVPYFLTFVAFLSVEIKQVDHIFENEESNATNTTISGGSGHGRHRHIYIFRHISLSYYYDVVASFKIQENVDKRIYLRTIEII